jgi:hypothetical protein
MTQRSNMAVLAKLVGALAPYDGTFQLLGTGVHAARVSQTNEAPVHYLQQSSLCLVALGAKIVTVGADTYTYEAGQMAVYSIDVPMAGRVTRSDLAWRSRVRLLSSAREREKAAARLLPRTRAIGKDVGDHARRTRRIPDDLSSTPLPGVCRRSAETRTRRASTQSMNVTAAPDEQLWFGIFRLGVWPDFYPNVSFSREPRR